MNTKNIEHRLNIWKFDTSTIDINNIIYVPMHEYRVTNNKLLLIDNLQCCIGLYAYSKDFAFGAHINPLILRNNEFIIDSNNKLNLNRIKDLKKTILKYTNNEIKIGIALGSSPLDKDYKTIKIIYESIYNLIISLKENYNIKKLHDINAPEFIIDIKHQNLILPKQKILQLNRSDNFE